MGGRIPKSFVDDLLARVDIVEIINLRVPLKRSGREYSACCPFHSEKTPSFTVSPVKQFYHCFGCGVHGTAIGFLMEHDHLDFVEAIEELARSQGLDVPREGGSQPVPRNDNLYELLETALTYYREQLQHHPAKEAATQYLIDRGLSTETTASFEIGLAPSGWNNLLAFGRARGVGEDTLIKAGLTTRSEEGRCYDRFRDRIMFPIRDRRGRVVGFGGRVMGDDKPKYLNSPETPVFHKGRELYGLYQARNRNRKLERLIVVEGYMDVVSLAQSGVTNAVATLGTATTREHLQTLFRTVPSIVFCFDGDRAGREAASRALETALPVMRDGREIRFLFLPDGEDPDTLVRKEGAEAFESRVGDSVLLSDLLLERLQSGLAVHKPDGRARLLDRARTLLGNVPGGVFWDLMVAELTTLSHLPEQRVRKHLTASGKPTIEARRHETAGVARTPVRYAIALLLYRPELAAEIEDPQTLAAIPEPGVKLLVEILEITRESPQINPAGILERYRGTEHEPALRRLIQWQPEIPDESLVTELRDTIHRLRQRHVPRRQLLEKLARGESLSDTEIETLRQLGNRAPASDPDIQT